MKWDQIESKWALMTRRIRADFGAEPCETAEVSARRLKQGDALTPGVADSQAFAARESEFKPTVK